MVKRINMLMLCFGGLLLPSWTQEGPMAIEYLARATTVRAMPYELRPDPTIRTSFESPILLSFDVPASPKSPAIFFDAYGQFIINWTSAPYRICNPRIHWRIISPEIPDNVDFYNVYGIAGIYETNYAGDHAYPQNQQTCRLKGGSKLAMRRDEVEWWYIIDKNTGHQLPEDDALSLINSLISKGFHVEVWAAGDVQGLSYIAPFAFLMEVTRLVRRQ